ncbi:MAG TPA: hypothetical protein VHE32_08855 [Rhodanobacteraceae bacterium]|jgi:hypothetical protein|nr:hypothetical protein [Rhodanobacteraceae bacterium]
MNHDILKRLGLDHLDVSSPDFLDALNRLQQEARENLHRTRPVNDPEFLGVVEDVPFPGFDWMPLPQE